ncbi:MAG TPA: MBL fold metallo-hydrolase [Rhizomicrobium sp.]|nr:MBL fold metallo-hydrolase [Rhizomicrobium sp.]
MRSGIPIAFGLAILFLAYAPLAAQPAGFILPDQAKQLTPHVYMITGFPNIAIIVGSTATLVVDTGLGPRNGATVANVAARLSKSPTLYLTTTHFHPEHAAGEAGFPKGTILIRPKVQQQELEDDHDTMLARFQQRPAFAGLLDNVHYRGPDVTFDRDYSLSLGDVHARLLYRGPAHTLGDEEVLVVEDGVLVTGDVVQNKTGPAIWGKGTGPADWLKTVKALEPLHPRLILPDHSPPGDGGTLITQEEEFLQALDDRAHALKAQGVPAAEAGETVTRELKARYPDWNIGSLSDAVMRAYAEKP